MIVLALAMLWLADVRSCACDPQQPVTLEARECSLCLLAERQPPGTEVFFVKDSNPSKPNRMLALPRRHYPGAHELAQMPAGDRTALWEAAIGRAKELWGENWALAYNGKERRTQCHTHLHIGRLSPDVIEEGFTLAANASEIVVPLDGTGLWVHPVNGKLHVHSGEQVTEFNLVR